MLGLLCTNFHCLKCRAREKVFSFDGSSTTSEVNVKENRNTSDLTTRSSKQVANNKLKIGKLTKVADKNPSKKN